MPSYNVIGRKFGKLTVVERLPKNSHGEAVWRCICDCGNEHMATSHNLIYGVSKQCKECKIAQIAQSNTKHNCKPKRLHEIWTNMKTRCHNPNYELYNRYGGRGITICDEWEKSFNEFRDWALKSGYADDLTLDRIDNDGNYCPENCKWSTRTEQANNRHTNRILVLDGIKDTMANWSRKTGIPYWLIQDRLYSGWSDEKTLLTPWEGKNGAS